MKAVVIGCGRMGAEPGNRFLGPTPQGWLPLSHLEALKTIHDINIVGICDANENALKKWGEYYSIQNLYTDFRKMIKDLKPDIVTIATRTPVKYEIIQYLCEHDVKGIYVEKPLTNSLQECKEILANIKAVNIKLAYGVNRRYHATYRQAKKMILDGCIGDILEIFIENAESKLLWTHPHSMDLILFLSGSTSIVEVQANIPSHSVDMVAEQNIDSDPLIENAIFKFSEGFIAYVTKTKGNNVRVSGTKGNLAILSDGACIRLDTESSIESDYFFKSVDIQPTIKESATVTALRELISSVSENSEPPIHHVEIERGMQMLMGCVWSYVNGGKKISINDIPQNLKVMGNYKGLYA